MRKRPLLIPLALGLAACGGHSGPDRVVAVDKALVGTTTVGARSNARTIALTTSAAQPWILVSAACTGGGTLNLTVHTPRGSVPFNPACNSPASGTEVASMKVRPDSGGLGPVTITVVPVPGQAWWVGAGTESLSRP